MKIKTSDATKTQINWLVAKKLGLIDQDIDCGHNAISKSVVID